LFASSIIYLNELLAPVGLTVGQAGGFLAAIVSSLLGARFASAESRRQHRQKVSVEKLSAATQVSRELDYFRQRLETKISAYNDWKSSNGNNGQESLTLSDVDLNSPRLEMATILGASVVEQIVLLKEKLTRAKDSLSSLARYEAEDDVSREALRWSAALALNVVAAINVAHKAAGIRLRAKSRINHDELVKFAGYRLNDVEYAAIERTT
jgi:hypothetical protein